MNMDIYNEAWREREETERLQAEGKWLNLNRMPLRTDEMFEIIKQEADEDLAAAKDYLDGKIDKPVKVKIFDRKRYTENPRYIMFPESFERDIASLSSCIGDLETADIDWIQKARKLIQEYNGVIYSPEGNVIYSPDKKKEPTGRQKTVRTLMSKACRIANKIPRSVSRKEAFSIAWKIAKNGGLEIKVAGVSFYNRQEALKRLAAYDPHHIHAFFVPEYDNQYDSNAIAVKVLVDGGKGVYRIGYVPKDETVIVKAFLGTVPELKVLDGDIRGAKVRIAA